MDEETSCAGNLPWEARISRAIGSPKTVADITIGGGWMKLVLMGLIFRMLLRRASLRIF